VSALLEVRDSPIHGKGAFATRRIPAETLIGEYEGERTSEDGTYVLWVQYDDGELVGIDGKNELRYLNHAATPNAYFWGHQLYALAEIAPDEEITFDYGEDLP
jgi:SET domain-containing protein